MPDLLKHLPNATETFLRQVMFAYFEMEKSLVVDRLKKGREIAKQRTTKMTVDGQPKVAGRNTLLQNLPGPMITKLKKIAKAKKHHEGWRTLATKFSKALNVENVKPCPMIGHTTAKRMYMEL